MEPLVRSAVWCLLAVCLLVEKSEGGMEEVLGRSVLTRAISSGSTVFHKSGEEEGRNGWGDSDEYSNDRSYQRREQQGTRTTSRYSSDNRGQYSSDNGGQYSSGNSGQYNSGQYSNRNSRYGSQRGDRDGNGKSMW